MGKYSSDSDSSVNGRGRYAKRSNRNKGRSRSSSTDSGHRRSQPKHKKRCKGRRSRSKDRYSKSRRYDRKSRRSSSSGSSSNDSKRKSRRSPVSSSSATNSSSLPPQVMTDTAPMVQSTPEQLRAKVQRAIEAARSADNMLRQRRGEAPIPDIPLIPQLSTLDDINSESFVQRSFSSSASAPRASLPEIPLPVVVDISEEPKHSASGDLGVMSSVLLEDQEGRQQRWVKKLFAIRQRALHGEPMIT